MQVKLRTTSDTKELKIYLLVTAEMPSDGLFDYNEFVVYKLSIAGAFL